MTQVTVDSLKGLFLEMSKKLIKKSDIDDDITPIFFRGIREKLIKGEQLKIVIIGQTTKGKSTVAAYLMWVINRMILDLKFETSYKGEEDNHGLISANQIEYLRIAKRSDLKQVCAVADEFSPLAQSGANATVEEGLLNFYDKVCAQNYIHTIYCTPGHDYDKYGVIILEVVDVDKDSYVTKLEVYYNNPTGYNPVFLGYLTINVEEVLKKEWYNLYRKQKMYAMRLPFEKGIRDVRELEFALVALMAYKMCESLAQTGSKDNDVTRVMVEEATQESKGVYSLIAREEVISKVRSLVTLTSSRKKIKDTMALRADKMTVEQAADMQEQAKTYKEVFNKIYKNQVELVNTYLAYLNIGNPSHSKEVERICEKYEIPVKRGAASSEARLVSEGDKENNSEVPVA